MKQKVAITIFDTGYDYKKEIGILKAYGFDVDYIPLEGTCNTNWIIEKVREYDFILAGAELWNREVIKEVKDRLKMIIRLGTGVDKVDIEAATEYGIAVCNTPGANACSVAQHVLAMMLDLSMSITKYNRDMRRGLSNRRMANDIIGRKVGLIGFGAVARELAKLLVGFETEIYYYDIVKNEQAATSLGLKYEDQEELISKSDYISLHVPLNKMTEGMVNINFLKKMKPTAYLINTSRGKVVNEADLIYALENGIIAGAGLDVFEIEPLPSDSPLLKLDNITITPYVAFSSRLGNERTFKMAIECIINYCDGREIKNLLNPKYDKTKMHTPHL